MGLSALVISADHLGLGGMELGGFGCVGGVSYGFVVGVVVVKRKLRVRHRSEKSNQAFA